MAYSVYVLVAVTLLATAEAVTKRGAQCIVSGKTYKDGDLVNLPAGKCIKYKCKDGALVTKEEGCEFKGRCYKVGSKFDVDCTTYSCTKSKKGDLTYYSVDVDSIRCIDSSNKCRRDGEVFPSTINGKLYSKCKCTVKGQLASTSCSN
ncbi:uncharacterized protein LOC131937956 [Physella acuta]|uniref:uncharacterized protein LOC131937956 n=1 Tax=Physella acuta TaxID=109671 RepID=UPI0027DC64CA|nr:uncharacterized protein LOC131937956 [Physella acuta]